jgi:hypothetical protein
VADLLNLGRPIVEPDGTISQEFRDWLYRIRDASGTVTLAGQDYLSILEQAITAEPIKPANIDATGVPSAATFLRGDGVWAAAGGGGGGDLLAANNLSDVADIPTSRSNLDVDQAGTDNSVNVTLGGENYLTIVGQLITAAQIAVGHISATGSPSSATFLRGDGQWAAPAGGGDLLAANDLSDVSSASISRTNLGLAIGSNVQAHSSVLDATTASYTSAEETKLAGIETAADVTDTANVTSSGALMDSEVNNLSGIKTLTIPDSATVSTFGASLVDDLAAVNARTTLDVDQAGTDNSTNVSLAGAPNYITIVGQVITRALINLTTHVTGTLPVANGGTGVTSSTGTGNAVLSNSPTLAGTITLPSGSISASGSHLLIKSSTGGNVQIWSGANHALSILSLFTIDFIYGQGTGGMQFISAATSATNKVGVYFNSLNSLTHTGSAVARFSNAGVTKLDVSKDGDVIAQGVPVFANLATSDPSNTGEFWNDSGTVKVSA